MTPSRGFRLWEAVGNGIQWKRTQIAASSDPRTQEAAIYSMGNIGGEEVQKYLYETAISNTNERVAKTALVARQEYTRSAARAGPLQMPRGSPAESQE